MVNIIRDPHAIPIFVVTKGELQVRALSHLKDVLFLWDYVT